MPDLGQPVGGVALEEPFAHGPAPELGGVGLLAGEARGGSRLAVGAGLSGLPPCEGGEPVHAERVGEGGEDAGAGCEGGVAVAVASHGGEVRRNGVGHEAILLAS